MSGPGSALWEQYILCFVSDHTEKLPCPLFTVIIYPEDDCMAATPLKKHIKIIPDYLRLALKRESEYKASFYSFIFHQLIGVAVWLIFWKALLGKIGDFGRWNFPMMVLLTGFVNINSGFWMSFSAVWRLPREVLSGELNGYLIKPIHPFLHFIFRRVNLRSVPRVLLGLGVIITALNIYDLPCTFTSVLLAAILSLLSFLTTFMPFAMICLSVFWIGQAEFLRDLFVELFVFQNYPLSEFPRGFIAVFTFIIPLIFSATIPVLALTSLTNLQSLGLLGLLLIIIICQIKLFTFIWRKGLKRYESNGG